MPPMRLPILSVALLATAACSQGSYVSLPAGPADGAAAQDSTLSESSTGDAEAEGGDASIEAGDARGDAPADVGVDSSSDAGSDAATDSGSEAAPGDGGDSG